VRSEKNIPLPENSLTYLEIETLVVAKFFRLDPDAVDNWTNIDFYKRQEFMFLKNEMEYLNSKVE
jgi:hypothetical protein